MPTGNIDITEQLLRDLHISDRYNAKSRRTPSTSPHGILKRRPHDNDALDLSKMEVIESRNMHRSSSHHRIRPQHQQPVIVQAVKPRLVKPIKVVGFYNQPQFEEVEIPTRKPKLYIPERRRKDRELELGWGLPALVITREPEEERPRRHRRYERSSDREEIVKTTYLDKRTGQITVVEKRRPVSRW